MRILTIYPHFPVTYGRLMARAFERLGHEVVHVGDAKGTYTGWGDVPAAEKSVDVPQQIPSGWRPDLVVNMDEYVRPKPARYPGFEDVPHVVYSMSNNVVDLSTPAMDQTFIAMYRGPELPYRDDGTITWLPPGYDPTLHIPSPIPWEDREYDVCFIGRHYQPRVVMLAALCAAGLTVFDGGNEIFDDDEYVRRYQDARFGFVSAGLWPGPKMRFYETPAMGCVPLVHQKTYEARFEADDAVAWFTDIVKCVRAWLANPMAAKALLARALAWVKPHTYDARAQAIIDWYEARNG